MKILKWTAIILAVLILSIQVIRPDRTNPPVDERKTLQATTTVPAEVNAILSRACNDCHTNNTVWPLYSNIAPLSWWVVDHVEEGREKMLFSEWGNYTPKRIVRKLEEICEQVEKGEMPLPSYLILHPAAELSDADKQLLCDWSTKEQARIREMQGDSLK